jgi:hypothetical protein
MPAFGERPGNSPGQERPEQIAGQERAAADPDLALPLNLGRPGPDRDTIDPAQRFLKRAMRLDDDAPVSARASVAAREM